LFIQKEDNIYYIRYIINLAVQQVLKILKAELAKETEAYQIIYNSTTFPIEFSKKILFQYCRNCNIIYIFSENSKLEELYLKNNIRYIELNIKNQLWIYQYTRIQPTI
jgi:hypothetical protein